MVTYSKGTTMRDCDQWGLYEKLTYGTRLVNTKHKRFNGYNNPK